MRVTNNPSVCFYFILDKAPGPHLFNQNVAKAEQITANGIYLRRIEDTNSQNGHNPAYS